jgi:hypothetical protein
MGTIKATNIEPIADNGTVTLGSSGDTFSLGSGVVQSNLMYPAFEVNLQGQSFNVATNTDTKVIMTNEVADTDSAYDTSTGRFTPQVAGRYYCYGRISFDATSDFDNIVINLKKNGTIFAQSYGRNFFYNTLPAYGIASFNGSSDYLELFVIQVAGGTQGLLDSGNGGTTMFGAYRIGS